MIRYLVGLLVTDMIQSTDTPFEGKPGKVGIGNPEIILQCYRIQRGHAAPEPGIEGFSLYQTLPALSGSCDAGESRAYHYRIVQCLSSRTSHICPIMSRPGFLHRGLERTICDYIAGMTDRYAIEEHARLNDPYLRP